MHFAYQNDSIEIPRQLAVQEAVLQEIRNSLARPITLGGAGLMQPITQVQGDVARAEVVPFRKREEPAKRAAPTPPHRPVPAQPLWPAAQSQQEQALGAMKVALSKRVAIMSRGDSLRHSDSRNLGSLLIAKLR